VEKSKNQGQSPEAECLEKLTTMNHKRKSRDAGGIQVGRLGGY
jgi:hypothetical protein